MLSSIIARVWVTVVCAVSAAHAISTISVAGSKFFDEDGNQFYIKGIAYQLTPDDPLTNTGQCALDAAKMKTVGANTIRVYHVDPNGDHSGCMAEFADAGIYLILDLDTFNTMILPTNSYWNQTQFNAYAKVMDAFQQYDNTLGFFIGNENIARANESLTAPYIKAAARDLKAYRDEKGYRNIPVGYSAADIAELRPMLQNYLACGGNASETIDFFGLNAYEWCGDSSYTVSGYATLNGYAQGYNIPIFFSETGCNTVLPRTFDDQSAIFGSDMSGTWSGAIVYEWINETNAYGLIKYGDDVSPTVVASGIVAGIPVTGSPIPITPDFTNLQNQWATLTPTGVSLSAYNTATLTPPACPASTAGGWLVDGNVKLPSLGQSQDATSATAATSSKASATGSAATTSSTKGSSASGGKEIAGMSIGLVAVMLTYIIWL